jgi:hypothetical protein
MVPSGFHVFLMGAIYPIHLIILDLITLVI